MWSSRVYLGRRIAKSITHFIIYSIHSYFVSESYIVLFILRVVLRWFSFSALFLFVRHVKVKFFDREEKKRKKRADWK
jgi:hypothetical protein